MNMKSKWCYGCNEIKELKNKIKELETPEEEPDDYEERLIRRNDYE